MHFTSKTKFTFALVLCTAVADLVAADTFVKFTTPRIVTDYKCQKDGAIHCWTNGKDYGSCNMTEGLVTNDYFLVQVVETETCTPGAFIGML
ncbi:hypothetical protein FPQ18DRAFT_399097 [Pyronema domesticum]|uniref:Uncharacterized protein n=1 Tax=Pyronema omphalodes (strain CBS 100304) TaxID=1076935 RepID=U4L7G5_PYROM|nr:hypothetical protein FPQ18DRAFT_399097 [Pyronema domesticum]CCX12564.1 Protein of unknown function [Pyronema omphalodes CBS 100304]